MSDEFTEEVRRRLQGTYEFSVPAVGFRAPRDLAGSFSKTDGSYTQPKFYRDQANEDYLPDPRYDAKVWQKLRRDIHGDPEPVPGKDSFMEYMRELKAEVDAAGKRADITSYKKGVMSKFTADMYDHQWVGITQLEILLKSRLRGAIVGDTMGTGKTRLACATMRKFQLEDRGSVPILVICPKSTVSQWEAELRKIEKGDDEMKVLRLTGHVDPIKLRTYDAIIVTQEKITIEYLKLEAYHKSFIAEKQERLAKEPERPKLCILSKYHKENGGFLTIIDEAHRAKKHDGVAVHALRLIARSRTLMLSGTVLDNKWWDIYGPLSILSGHPWQAKSDFDTEFLTMPGKGTPKDSILREHNQNATQRQLLVEVLSCVMLRRKATDLLRDRPIRVIDEEFVLTDVELELSDTWFDAWEEKEKQKRTLSDLHKARAHSFHPVIEDSATRVRPAPAGRGSDTDGEIDDMDDLVIVERVPTEEFDRRIEEEGGVMNSSRMIAFKNLFGALYKQNRIIVVAEQTRKLHIASRVIRQHFPDVKIYQFIGKTSCPARNKLLKEFEGSEIGTSVLMLSLNAGGTGTDMNEATLMIQLEVGWNRNIERQVHSRINRSKKGVQPVVHRLIAANAKVDAHLKKMADLKIGYIDKIIEEIEVPGLYPWSSVQASSSL